MYLISTGKKLILLLNKIFRYVKDTQN